MFSVFIVLVAIRIMNNYVSKNASKPVICENPNIGENRIENYSPMVFHLIIIILILISCFTPGIMSAERIGILVADGIFQFVSTMLIVIIALINPFVSFSPETRLKIEQQATEPNAEWLNWFLKDKNWQLMKALSCVLIVAYFVYNKYLVIPSLDQGIISGIAVILILFFVFGNVIQLIKNPELFKQKTIYRMSMLFRSFKLSFFISVGLILVIFITSAILKLDIDKLVNIQGIVLLVYNVVMAYNEFKILNS